MFFDTYISNGKSTKNIVMNSDFSAFFYFYFFLADFLTTTFCILNF